MSCIWNVSVNWQIIGSNLVEFRFSIRILPSLNFVPAEVSFTVK